MMRPTTVAAAVVAVLAASFLTLAYQCGKDQGRQEGATHERIRFLGEAVAHGYAKDYRNGRYEWRSPEWHGECVPLEIHAELYWVNGSGWTVVGVRKNNHPCAPESCRTKESDE